MPSLKIGSIYDSFELLYLKLGLEGLLMVVLGL